MVNDFAGRDNIYMCDVLEHVKYLDIEDEDDAEELAELEELIDQVGDDASLVAEHAFQAYAQDFAEETGMLADSSAWPAYCIDWERAAWDLANDYTVVEFGGYTYYVVA